MAAAASAAGAAADAGVPARRPRSEPVMMGDGWRTAPASRVTFAAAARSAFCARPLSLAALSEASNSACFAFLISSPLGPAAACLGYGGGEGMVRGY